MARSAFRVLIDSVRGLSRAKQEPLEWSVYNPLRARVGDTLMISPLAAPGLPEGSDKTGFEIRQIDEYSTMIGGEIFLSADYLLLRQEGGLEFWKTLRLIPTSRGSEVWDYLLLSPDEQSQYNEKFHLGLSGDFCRRMDPSNRSHLLARYRRIDNKTTPQEVKIREVKPDATEISLAKIELWDFVRELPESDGGGLEYYFWEISTEDGEMRSYVGREVSARDVELCPTKAASEVLSN